VRVEAAPADQADESKRLSTNGAGGMHRQITMPASITMSMLSVRGRPPPAPLPRAEPASACVKRSDLWTTFMVTSGLEESGRWVGRVGAVGWRLGRGSWPA